MADGNESPIRAAKPPVVNPMSTASGHAATLKLKPVIRKPTPGATAAARPMIRKPGAAAAPAPAAASAPAPAPQPAAPTAMDQLKGMTQKLKGITQAIPAQAILHKTGIIADQDMTEAQKQASKSRTARISLSDAIGVAPVKDEAAPMKTIRIKRPVDLQGSAPKPAAPAPAAAPAEAESAPAAAPAPTMTQRKTLKIARPGTGVRPTGKFGIKKPAAAAPAAEAGEVADLPEVADLAPVAAAPAQFVAAPVAADGVADVGKGLQVVDLVLQIAACIAVGFLAWKLYLDTTTIFAF